MLEPLYRWIWHHPGRRARKLFSFAAVEADGGRDLVRAAELTRDPLLRRLYLAHASDECRHAGLFHDRGVELLRDNPAANKGSVFQAEWLAPGERGLDDLRVEREGDGALLAFLHLSEKAAARSFALYRNALPDDPATRSVFEKVLRDEEFHMKYTRAQLSRIEPERQRVLIWRARLGRLWKGYLRLAMALAGAISGVILTLLYFTVLPPFALLAKRAMRKEPQGWTAIPIVQGGAPGKRSQP
jgi:rubrerythrin